MKTPTVERPHPGGMGGMQRLYQFNNGFGASVVRTPYTYGGNKGLWELAVIIRQTDDWGSWTLTYETPITDDTEGWLTEDAVDELLEKVKALPAMSHKNALAETHAKETETRASMKRLSRGLL